MYPKNDEKALLRALDDMESGFDVRPFIYFVWRLKWWMLLCLCLTAGALCLYDRTREPVQAATCRAVFVEPETVVNNFSSMTVPISVLPAKDNKDGMLLLKSPALMARVVDSLHLHTGYYRAGGQEYYKDSPFFMDITFDSDMNRPSSVEVEFTGCDDEHYEITAIHVGSLSVPLPAGGRAVYGQEVRFSCGTFSIGAASVSLMLPGVRFRAVYTDPGALSCALAARLSTSFERFSNQSTNVVMFTLSDVRSERAVDILNRLIPEYNALFREYRVGEYQKILSYVDDRLNAASEGPEDVSEQLSELRESVAMSMNSIPDRLRMVEQATVSSLPTGIGSWKKVIMILLAGLLLPVAVVLLRGVLRTAVETEDDLTRKLDAPVIGTIFRADRKQSVPDESFTKLCAGLTAQGGEVIQITSSVRGEGKTFVAVNLAVTLARMHHRVALLGLDLRHPSLETYFPKENEGRRYDIAGCLAGECRGQELIPVTCSSVSGGQMDVFFAGPVPPDPAVLLSSDRLKDLVERCRADYDYVICDTASYISTADASMVRRCADAVLYVVRCGHTPLQMLPEIRELMDSEKMENASLLLNCLDAGSWKYRYAYHYRYLYSHSGGPSRR